MTANEMKALFLIKFDSLFEFNSPAYSDEYISEILTDAQLRVFLSKYNPLANRTQSGFESTEQRRRELQQLVNEVKIDCESSSLKIISGTAGNYYIVSNPNNIGFAIGDSIYIGESYVGGNGYVTITGLENSVIYIDKPLLVSIAYEDYVAVDSTIGRAERSNDNHLNGYMIQLPKLFLYAIEEGVTLYSGELGTEQYSELNYESRVKPIKHDEFQINISNPYKTPYTKMIWRLDVGNPSFKPTDFEFHKRVELVVPSGYKPRYYRLRYLSYPTNIVINEDSVENQVNCILDESIHREIVDEAVSIAVAASKEENYNIGRAEANISE